jgi:predicted nucleotidyltransferase
VRGFFRFFEELFAKFRKTFYFCSKKSISIMGKDECITLLRKYMDILKDKYGIISLSLFGSTARGDQKEGSDIDLFVDTKTPNPFLLMDAKRFLENETGASVDIVRNHQNLNPRLKKRILKDGIFIF